MLFVSHGQLQFTDGKMMHGMQLQSNWAATKAVNPINPQKTIMKPKNYQLSSTCKNFDSTLTFHFDDFWQTGAFL